MDNVAVIRVEKTQNYTVMSNHHLRNKELSLKAKGLMSLMLSLPPAWDYSIGGLVAICKESHTSIRSALKELEENRYLIRERKNNEKGYFIYEYTLYEMPEPHTVNQHMDKQHTEKQHTENRRQIKKDVLNKDELSKDVLSKEKYKEPSGLIEVLDELVYSDSLKALYKDYIELRVSIEAPLTKRGLKMLIERCERLSNNNVKVQELLLESAIINGWKNVYLPNEAEINAVNQQTANDLRAMFGLD